MYSIRSYEPATFSASGLKKSRRQNSSYNSPGVRAEVTCRPAGSAGTIAAIRAAISVNLTSSSPLTRICQHLLDVGGVVRLWCDEQVSSRVRMLVVDDGVVSTCLLKGIATGSYKTQHAQAD